MPNTTPSENIETPAADQFTAAELAMLEQLLPLPEQPGQALSPGGFWLSNEEFDSLRDAAKTGETL
mgnify:CR=1 FL=1